MRWLALAWLAAAAVGFLAMGCGDDDDDDDDNGGGDDDASPADDDDDNDAADDDAADDDDLSDDDLDDDDDDDDNTPHQGHAMVLFHGDDANAMDFSGFLTNAFHSVFAVELDDFAPGTDVSDYDLFLVDGTAGEGDWTAAKAETLTATGKPIIGVADGVYVFEHLDQYLDYGATWGSGSRDLVPVELTHPLWTTPNDLGLTDTDPVQILTDAGAIKDALYDDGSSPPGVEFLARQSGETAYYMVAVEDGKYALWGYSDGPSSYTSEGALLFLNLIDYVRNAK